MKPVKKGKKKEEECNHERNNGQVGKSNNQSHLDKRENEVQEAAHSPVLVDDLNIFRNHQLINQEDPMQCLTTQVDELKEEDGDANYNKKHRHRQGTSDQAKVANNNTAKRNKNLLMMTKNDRKKAEKRQGLQGKLELACHPHHQDLNQTINFFDSNDDCNSSTIKKGVLLENQNYDRFANKLFRRWKKRYFILTTDYLVCFKRTPARVGRSEMGKFLYKAPLSDITKLEWSKPTKNDKGAIVLDIRHKFNLFIWCKDNLDEWMLAIGEQLERSQARRCNGQIANKLIGSPRTQTNCTGIREMHMSPNKSVPAMPDEQLPELIYENAPNDPTELHSSPKESRHHSTETIDANNHIKEVKASLSRTQINQKHNLAEGRDQNSNISQLDANNNEIDGGEEKNLNSKVDSQNDMHNQEDKQRVDGDESEPKCIPRRRRADREENIGAEDDEAPDPMLIYDPKNETIDASTGSSVASSDIQKSQSQSTRTNEARLRLAESAMAAPQEAKKEPRKSKQFRLSSSEHEIEDENKRESESESSRERNNCDPKSITSRKQTVTENGANLSAINQKGESKSRSRCTTENEAASGVSGSGSRRVHSSGRRNPGLNAEPSSGGGPETSLPAPRPIGDRDGQPQSGQSGECDSELECKEVNESPLLPNAQIDAQKGGGNSCPTRAAQDKERNFSNGLENGPHGSTNGAKSIVTGQPGKRSLRAQQSLISETFSRDKQLSRRHKIDIESTVTPSRGPLMRHHSLMGGPRPYAHPLVSGQFPLGCKTNGEIATPSASPFANSNHHKGLQQHQFQFQQQQQQQFEFDSCQQKLWQLQLLHNSNNVDYIRSNGTNGPLNDYQIYAGPEYGAFGGSYYGYSSMRSNLKSAASEFSFVRPTSTSNYKRQLQAAQAPSGTTVLQLDDRASNSNNQSVKSPFRLQSSNTTANLRMQIQDEAVHPGLAGPLTSPNRYQHQQQLLNPVTADTKILDQNGIVRGGEMHHQFNLARLAAGDELTAPLRELPMKPGRKRNSGKEFEVKGSSLTSSIASFFRRAFSRRSKKNRRPRKLASDCSNSIGAFEHTDNLSPLLLPEAPSAFSTGGKSIVNNNPGRDLLLPGSAHQLSHQPQTQSQRMVDMIKALNSQTEAAEVAAARLNQDQAARQDALINHQAQFGSPLLKSNSISAAMGLDYYNQSASRKRYFQLEQRQIQENNQNYPHLPCDNDLTTNSPSMHNGFSSPLMLRSSKVMSANLTPTISGHQQQQRRLSSADSPYRHLIKRQAHRGSSPRLQDQQANGMQGPLPRPSSIYGQPSLISSNYMGQEFDEHLVRSSANFGGHRGSLQNSRLEQDVGLYRASGAPWAKKTPFLDPTCELAEMLEQDSPRNESQRHRDPNQRQEYPLYSQNAHRLDEFGKDGAMMISSPSSGRLVGSKRQAAIVTPIMQSPTMNTIYDNHPMIFTRVANQLGRDDKEQRSYSHYDNHFQSKEERSSSSTADNLERRMAGFNHSSRGAAHLSPLVRNQFEGSDRSNFDLHNSEQASLEQLQLQAGPYASSSPRISNSASAAAVAYQRSSVGKPIELVTPSRTSNYAGPDYLSSRQMLLDSSGYQQQSESPSLATRPLPLPGGTYHQHSPLAAQRTRLVKMPDGSQAVNIACAPGINLEPALAASLLRGSSLETQNFDSSVRPIRSQQQSLDMQGFHIEHCTNSSRPIVSNRSSKSIALSKTSNDSGLTMSSNHRDTDDGTTCAGTGSSRATSLASWSGPRVEPGGSTSSSSSSSASSGTKSSSSSANSANSSLAKSNRDDKFANSGPKSSSSKSASEEGSRKTKNSFFASVAGDSHHNSKIELAREESIDDPMTDEIGSEISDFDKTENRNWITSKLID